MMVSRSRPGDHHSNSLLASAGRTYSRAEAHGRQIRSAQAEDVAAGRIGAVATVRRERRAAIDPWVLMTVSMRVGHGGVLTIGAALFSHDDAFLLALPDEGAFEFGETPLTRLCVSGLDERA